MNWKERQELGFSQSRSWLIKECNRMITERYGSSIRFDSEPNEVLIIAYQQLTQLIKSVE